MPAAPDPHLTAFAEWVKDTAPIFAPVVSAVAAWVLGRRQRKKSAENELADAMTRRFTALMDGYETRITDLTKEVESLRSEIVTLRGLLDERHAPAVGFGQ